MRQTKSVLHVIDFCVLLVLTLFSGICCASLPSAPPSVSSAAESVLLRLECPGSVFNKPTQKTIFNLQSSMRITKILTEHWNYGLGATPGSIGLRSLDSNQLVGTWQAVGTSRMLRNAPGTNWPAQNEKPPHHYWVIQPNITLPPGRYEVVDSSPATWSTSSEIEYRGSSLVVGSAAQGGAEPEQTGVAQAEQKKPAAAPVIPPPAAPLSAVPPEIDLAGLINPDALAGGRLGGEVLATKGLMRLLTGPLTADQEKAFNAQYAAAYTHPQAKTAAHHRKLNQHLIDTIVQRELLLRSLREHDAALHEARLAEQLGDRDGQQEALKIASLQTMLMQQVAAKLDGIRQSAEQEPVLGPDKTSGAAEYQDALAALKNLNFSPDNTDYLGRWLLDKTQVVRTWSNQQEASLNEGGATLNYTYIDHGYTGRHRGDEELHNKWAYSWGKPPAVINGPRKNQFEGDEVSMTVSIKDAGTEFVPADYKDKPYACYDRARSWVRADIVQRSVNEDPTRFSYAYLDNSPPSSVTAEAGLDRNPGKTKLAAQATVKARVRTANTGYQLAIQTIAPPGGVIYLYRWEANNGSAAGLDPLLADLLLSDSLDAQQKAALAEHLTNIAYAQKALNGYKQDLAKTQDPAVSDRLRFSMLHLEQDIHDAKDMIESIKTGKVVHTRGPWEQHVEAVAAQQARAIADQAERAHQMQASALRMAAVLGKYSPEVAKRAHELILTQISTGIFDKNGMTTARQALEQIHAMTREACLKNQAGLEQDQATTAATAQRTARNLEYVESLKKNADRAIFVGTLFTPVGPGAVISIAYEGVSTGVEKGPVEAIKKVAKDAALMATMVGAVKGGEYVLGKFLNPAAAASTEELFSAAKFQEEMKLNQALVTRVKETRTALDQARKAGMAAEDLTKLESAATDAVSAANSSTLAKRIMKSELNQAEEALRAATKQVRITAGNPDALKAAVKAEAEAAQALREVEATHAGFQESVKGIYTKVDDAMVRELQSQGYNVEKNWFTEFRNATSKGINGDRDLGLKGELEAFLKREGRPTSLEGFMEDAQKAYEKNYRKLNNGRSAKLADQNVTTSLHNESFPLEFLDSAKVGTASRDTCKRAGQTIYNKVENALAGSDPEFVKLQKAYASLSKDLKTKVLPVLDTALAGNQLSNAAKAQTRVLWEEVTHVMDDFAKNRIDPLDATRQISLLTGGKTMRQVAGDVARLMQGKISH